MKSNPTSNSSSVSVLKDAHKKRESSQGRKGVKYSWESALSRKSCLSNRFPSFLADEFAAALKEIEKTKVTKENGGKRKAY